MTLSPGQSPPNALLSFTTKNARSYRDETHLSLLATRLSADDIPRSVVPAGMTREVRVLPAVGILGANASGKTAMLLAMADMRHLVVTSFRDGNRGTPVVRKPFLLDPDCGEGPTRFEVDLLLDGVRWVYGFAVDNERVVEEAAHHWPRGRRALVFRRKEGEIVFGSHFRADDRAITSLLRDNTLLLSVAGATANRKLVSLFDWFKANMRLLSSGNRDSRSVLTARMAQTQDVRVMALIRAADLGITNIELEAHNISERFDLIKQILVDNNEPLPEFLDHFLKAIELMPDLEIDLDSDDIDDDLVVALLSEIRLTHVGVKGSVVFGPDDESKGTLVWISLVGSILRTLDEGSVVLVDELDSSLHPHLVERIISIFQSPAMNPRGAQIIFNTHEVSVLKGDRALGRDQIWFTEKYGDGATTLYPLDDFSPRRDDDIQGRYFRGRYGAIPVVGDTSLRNALVTSDE